MKIEINLTKGPQEGPERIEIQMSKKQYSKPKLYIPKKNGKPIIEPGKPWYIWFMWRNSETGNLDIKCKFKKGINRFNTAKERKAVGESLCKAYETALDRGWNPLTKKIAGSSSSRKNSRTLEKALDYAYEIKSRGNKSQPTLDGYKFHLKRFKEWATDQGLIGIDVQKFTIEHFYDFLDYIRFEYLKANKEPMSGTSVNNHKRSLSALFTTLKNERLIHVNFIKGIPNVDEDPVNNKAFTPEELKKIKEALLEKDPYMVYFVQFILYPLLRPREICRLKVRDLNTDKWYLQVQTKTDRLSKRRIIDKLKPTIEALNLDGVPGHYSVFTNLNKPGEWETQKLKSKVDHFGRRFSEVKTELGFGREYSIYSCRHTAIMDLYHSKLKSGMSQHEIYPELMQYTQHKSLDGLKRYLRKHMHVLPPDHSDIYTIDF